MRRRVWGSSSVMAGGILIGVGLTSHGWSLLSVGLVACVVGMVLIAWE